MDTDCIRSNTQLEKILYKRLFLQQQAPLIKPLSFYLHIFNFCLSSTSTQPRFPSLSLSHTSKLLISPRML